MNRAKWTEEHRVTSGPLASDSTFGDNGAFRMKFGQESLFVVISDGIGWDHVSVSHRGRTPTWQEMCFVKDAFFGFDDWVVQYHPAIADYVNCHPYCLHLWRPQNADLPKPPSWLVGPKSVTPA